MKSRRHISLTDEQRLARSEVMKRLNADLSFLAKQAAVFASEEFKAGARGRALALAAREDVKEKRRATRETRARAAAETRA